MANPNLNAALKWAIENSEASKSTQSQGNNISSNAVQQSQIDPAVLDALFGGPSDADMMRVSMAAIRDPDISLENKLVAFDNFEQLIESIDNANNMEALGMWTPMVDLLQSEEDVLRRMAAWCIATAVQNNIKAQERMHAVGAVPILAKMATADSSPQAKKKAILALSSGIRNYQPSLDLALKHLPESYTQGASIDATDMEAVDRLIQRLRDPPQQSLQ